MLWEELMVAMELDDVLDENANNAAAKFGAALALVLLQVSRVRRSLSSTWRHISNKHFINSK